MKTQRGFTLVEVLVVGVIASFIGMSAFTLFQMNARQAREGTLRTALLMQAEIAAAQIGKSARSANALLAPGETWPPDPALAAVTGADTVFMKTATGADTAGYRISGGGLQERLLVGGVWNWADFQVAGRVVGVAAGSGFDLSADRKTLTLRLAIKGASGALTDSVAARGEIFLCRN